MLKIGVLASGNLGYQTLLKLKEDYNVMFVFTDSKSFKIIEYCEKSELDIFIGNPRNGATIDFLKNKPIEILISINYLFLIEDDVISHPTGLAFNIHGSLLPKYRGRTPHVWAIINGEEEVGISAHKLEIGCDTGDIIEQVRIPVLSTDTGNDILIRYGELYFPLVKTVLEKYLNNTISFSQQNELEATYNGKRTPEDGELDWSWNSKQIVNWVRAQAFPYPGAFTYIKGKKIIIDKAQLCESFQATKSFEIGEVVQVNPDIIKCKSGFIEIKVRNISVFQVGDKCRNKKYE